MEKELKYQKNALNHFRLSIIDAKLSYVLFKTLYQSRAENIVGKQLFDKYFWVQKQHGGFFTKIEHCAVVDFVIRILHGFDNDKQALTLKDIDEKAYAEFIKKYQQFIDKLKRLRDKSIAHFDKKQPIEKKLPSFEQIDRFFTDLENFYNGLSGKIEDSKTTFEQDKNLKYEIEKVLQNLYVGEKNRLLNVELEYS
jgi:hypothetical protein